MTEATKEKNGQTTMPRFAGAGSPQGRKNHGWLWLGLVVLVVALATVAMIIVNRGPDQVLAQANTANQPVVSNTATTPASSPSAPSSTSSSSTGANSPTPAPTQMPTTMPPSTGNVPSGTTGSAPTANALPATSAPVNDFTPQLRHGLALITDGKLVEGRTVLSDLYVTTYHELTREDAQAIRDTLTSVNMDLVFGPKVSAGDPLVELYEVKAGDVLTKVTLKYKIPYPLVEVINKTQANRIRVGQKLKMIQGPMHAVVRKGEFRMDVFVNGPDGKPVYVRSFPVGLGEEDSTPPGTWVLSGKVQNPSWTNPRTRQSFTADDPANPIGEFWIGLQGTDEGTQGKRGYGIHGTIEPESIGRMMSMGCIRMRHDDISLLFKMLYDKLSTVKVEP